MLITPGGAVIVSHETRSGFRFGHLLSKHFHHCRRRNPRLRCDLSEAQSLRAKLAEVLDVNDASGPPKPLTAALRANQPVYWPATKRSNHGSGGLVKS